MNTFTFNDPEEGSYKAEITGIKIDGIWLPDYPDFADAYIESADVGEREATEEELDQMNDNGDFRYDMIAEFGDYT